MNNFFDSDTRTGTMGGMLLVLLNINPPELLNTVVIAATGAIVSFMVSVLCKFVWEKINGK